MACGGARRRRDRSPVDPPRLVRGDRGTDRRACGVVRRARERRAVLAQLRLDGHGAAKLLGELHVRSLRLGLARGPAPAPGAPLELAHQNLRRAAVGEASLHERVALVGAGRVVACVEINQ